MGHLAEEFTRTGIPLESSYNYGWNIRLLIIAGTANMNEGS